MADVNDETFGTAVVERSKTVPVVIDLWADWCGPCKTLGPILEKVIGETQGLVELAKVDVEANPQVAGAFQVQSIPAVYAMKDEKIIDGFVGALPEEEVVAFVQRVLDASTNGAPAADEDAPQDEVVPEGDVPQDVVQDAAQAMPAMSAAPVMSEPGANVTPTPPAPSAAEGDAIEAELQSLLTQVKGDDTARERFLELLEQLGVQDPRTNLYRRKLATALY